MLAPLIAAITTSYVPVATGQNENVPAEFVTVSMTTRSMPFWFCSRATTTFPPTIGCCVAESITNPLMDVLVDWSATSPACSTGFILYCPLPWTTTEAHALKSMFKSLLSPDATVNCPPAICPEGILIPVVVSEDIRMLMGVLVGSLVSIRQFAYALHLLPFTLTLLSARITRICWYEPGARPLEPSVARKH